MKIWKGMLTVGAAASLIIGCSATPEVAHTAQTVAPAPALVETGNLDAPEALNADAPTAIKAGQQGAGSAAIAAKYKHWAPVHAFMGAPVVAGSVVSSSEAVAFTKDNHVGVTTDGGASWGFVRHTNGTVQAVAGVAGGPYFAVGKGGYMAMSENGKSWRDLPRYTGDDLIGVSASASGVVAIGKKGSWVALSSAGKDGNFGIFPDKFKAKAIATIDGSHIAYSGKKGYTSGTGKTWNKLETLPTLPSKKEAATSKGVCKISKVGKKKGVVCTVKGLGIGVASNSAFVSEKDRLSFTSNGASTWSVATLPFSGLTTVIGTGPYYAIGKKGALAISQDGRSWTERPLNATKTLHTGIVDGSTILLVGDGGTIVRSGDGGASWAVLPAPVSKSFKQIVKVGSKLVIPLGKSAIESVDGGQIWTEMVDVTELESIPAVAKAGKCGARLPAPGETCKFQRDTTSTMGLPNVKAFNFQGETGLAVGDAGLVAFTSNGGANWNASNGFGLRKLQAFDTAGSRVVALGGKSVIVSTDSGASFKEAQLPKKIGKIAGTHIAADGAVYAYGTKGTILKSQGTLDLWTVMNTGEKNKTAFIHFYELDGTLYAAGKKGGLYRSRDQGGSWIPIATGVKAPVIAMTSEGTTVLAIAAGGRKSGNRLLRSDDGGYHFYVQREISHQGAVADFKLSNGSLRYRDRVSTDYGETWTQAVEVYYGGGAELPEAPGYRLANGYSYYGKPKTYVAGTTDGDWTIIDSFYNYGARFFCEKESGCWMVSGGQVYRPL